MKPVLFADSKRTPVHLDLFFIRNLVAVASHRNERTCKLKRFLSFSLYLFHLITRYG